MAKKNDFTPILTEATIGFLKFLGCHVWDQHQVGLFVQGRFITLIKEPGFPDIGGFLPNGRSLNIEIKTGKDYQKPDQKEFQKKAEQHNAIYIIVRSFKDFPILEALVKSERKRLPPAKTHRTTEEIRTESKRIGEELSRKEKELTEKANRKRPKTKGGGVDSESL